MTVNFVRDYWDWQRVAEKVAEKGSYCDWEGMYSRAQVIKRVDAALSASLLSRESMKSDYPDWPERYDFIRDMLMHYASENLSEGGRLPSVTHLMGMTCGLDYVLSSPRWMKSNT